MGKGYAFADYLLGYMSSWTYASGVAVGRLQAFSQAYHATDIRRISRSRATAGSAPYLEFRLEAFNVLNHPNWGEPDTTLSNVSFGRINTTRGEMRQIQFGLKLVF
jgi:hypothetical protein